MIAPRVVVMGVSAAGKTTVGAALARRLGVGFVDADDLHPRANVDKMAAGHALTDADRKPWLALVGARLHGPEPVVIACSALRRSYRTQLRAAGPSQPRFVFLDVSRPVLEQRIASRTSHFMPASLLDDQLATLERPSADEPDVVVIDADRPTRAVIDASLAVLS